MKRETIKTIQANEVSQLPLYAFTALALTFGRARIALVGDIRQLPPFEDPDLPRDLAAFAISRILASATRTKAFPVINLIVGRRCPPPITKIYLNALSVRSSWSSPRGHHRSGTVPSSRMTTGSTSPSPGQKGSAASYLTPRMHRQEGPGAASSTGSRPPQGPAVWPRPGAGSTRSSKCNRKSDGAPSDTYTKTAV
uniref:AAA_12 domain-containing protein n=1 Tax=Caenorhabditis japonica TaxID=281687 RepID=A0A8R1IA58_CAEJA